MSLPPNFGRAVDLSSLGKPKPEPTGPMPGIEITPQNLTTEFLALSKSKPVILICWSPRSAESQEVVAILGKLALADQDSWIFGRVDVDAQPQVAQALQARAVPFAVAIIDIVPVIGAVVLFVGVNTGIFPDPEAAKPIAGLELVHA